MGIETNSVLRENDSEGSTLKNENNSELLLPVIDAVVKRTMRMDLVWDWPCGVAYYGICAAYAATGCEEYLSLVKERVDEYIELGLPRWTVNTCAMGHSMITLHEATGDNKYLQIALGKLAYLRGDAPRFAENVLQHTVSANNDFPEQAWADTLFMAALFMLRMGSKLNDPAVTEDALNQFYWHIKYLHDPETGLWYHGYDNIAGNHMSGFYWGRANAWAAYTMSQVRRYLQAAYLYPRFMDIVASLNEQLAALKLLQTPDGLWRTLLDDPESYEEVSASCGIAAAMIALGNPLHRKYIDKSLEGVLRNISADGRVLNVSGGTAVMKDRDGYRNISREWIQGWGQGLALTFLSGALKK
ncbi:MAG: glycoside hydrolase family 88 protein [Treponema sp.]|nr:glycoside hydrolase family 88 protein [Treponema sp.]